MSRRERRGHGSFYSLTVKLFVGVTACVTLVVLLMLTFNNFALNDYYIRQKKATVEAAFHAINDAADNVDTLREQLIDLQDNASLSTTLWSGRQLLYSTQNSDRFLAPNELPHKRGSYTLDISDKGTMLDGINAGDPAIRLVGTLDNGWHIYLRSPIAAIEESVAVTNRFLLFAGLAALLISLVAVLILSRRFTDPLRQLSAVARQVAELDFSGRYTGDSRDEIGELGRSINQMSAALEESISMLKNANARLVADNRRKDEQDKARSAFIANVSHELKTPIALIGTYAEGLREDIAGGGDNRDYYCGVIEDEAHKISQLLRRMTLLMQLESGGEQLEIERFDIVELLTNLAEKLRPRFEEKHAVLHLAPCAPVCVWADPYLMENVLQNYLSNALNHVTDGGGVTIGVTRLSAARVRVSVHNTGSPIPAEDLPRVWESFYKVDKARTRAYGGSGIGLSVVAAVMNAHGMPYGVTNRDDGVEFFIELETK